MNSKFHYVYTYAEQQRTEGYDVISFLSADIYDHTLVVSSFYSHLSPLIFKDLSEPQGKK